MNQRSRTNLQQMPDWQDAEVYQGDRPDSLDNIEKATFYGLVPLGALIILCLVIGMIVSAVTS